MSRCGCSSPCPACPGAEYVDYLDPQPLDIPLVGTVVRVLIQHTVNIPAGLPGFGVVVSASGSFSLFGENTGATVITQLLDGVVTLQASVLGNSPTFGIMATNTTEVDAILGAEQQLAPGNHTFTYQVTAVLAAGTGTLRVNAATMDIRLVRADNLTVTGAP